MSDNICPNSTRRSLPKLVASMLAFSIPASIPLACLVPPVAYISSSSRYGVVPGGEVAFKKILKLHVAQGQPVSSDLWMTSSYSFFKKFSGSPLDDQPLQLLQENSVVRVEFPLDGTPLSYHPTVPAPSTLKVDITLQIVPST